MTRRSLMLGAIASYAGSAPLLRAQQETTFSSDVKVVNVLATVRGRDGRIVSRLEKDDFALEEDGRAQTIKYFSRETDLPLTLGLVIDDSGSQRRVLGAEGRASHQFLEQVLREDKDHGFLIHFSREVELLQDITNSRAKLERALDGLQAPDQSRPQWGGGGGTGGGGMGGRYPGAGNGGGGRGGRGGGTTLYDAVLLASDELMRRQTGRKALIVLSDGVDNASKVSLTTAIEAAQKRDTLAYSILFSDSSAYNNGGGFGQRGGFGGMGRHGGGMGMPPRRAPEEHVDGKAVLQRLARETGGSYFEVSNKLPIGDVFTRIEEELRSQYSLGYSPERTDISPGFHRIRVSTKQSGYTVQTRDGYWSGVT